MDGTATPAGTEVRGWRVRGRVQGVGFRWWVQREGSRLGLDGWVRNRKDGSVEVRARGEGGPLDRLAERLAEGPPASSVAEVERVPGEAPGVGDGFGIRETV
jgi:acylphosphatase